MKTKLHYKYILFLLIILCMQWYWEGQDKILFLRPQSVHQWGQCDRASVALNFANGNMNFFQPQVNNLDNGTGITGMECPLVNYSAAILYRCFGFHEFLYRGLMLLLLAFGLVYALRLCFWWTQNIFFSLAATSMISASPLISFYAANFQPDIAGMAFVFAAWYYCCRYSENKNPKYGKAWALFVGLATLIKITLVAHLPAMVMLVVLTDKNDRIKSFIKEVKVVTVPLLITACWYFYASWLSRKYSSNFFLLTWMPPRSWFEFTDSASQIWIQHLSKIYNYVLISILIALLYFLPFFYLKKKDIIILIFSFLLAPVSILLLLIWWQLRDHDYYLIILFPVFIFSLMCILKILDKSKILKYTFVSVLAILSIYETSRASDYLTNVYDRENCQYGTLHFDNYFFIEDILKKNGIQQKDAVISVYDHTPNVSLYLMNRKGVSVAYRKNIKALNTYIYSGRFRYLIFDKESLIEGFTFDPKLYPLKFKCSYGSLMIYKVTVSAGISTKPFVLTPWM